MSGTHIENLNVYVAYMSRNCANCVRAPLPSFPLPPFLHLTCLLSFIVCAHLFFKLHLTDSGNSNCCLRTLSVDFYAVKQREMSHSFKEVKFGYLIRQQMSSCRSNKNGVAAAAAATHLH